MWIQCLLKKVKRDMSFVRYVTEWTVKAIKCLAHQTLLIIFGCTVAERAVTETLKYGRNGVMPAFNKTLGDDKIHVVDAYIYSLSNEN